ncbi:sulfatase-like hydrolase/transferase [Paenibacillus sp. IB182496]|uniref:Sulfatase-like hydrolase/transferase n=1 Tax=Paenibacillus sabuli TaxID=2772509 RepID=A0A927BVM4_9BACL|nr:sulfatase-like hydrolase/transferase [Paenibacillus sabuli]MBD2847177.1 sulfatase-like hydrolase/transferase [Paenibacillus sabuli]
MRPNILLIMTDQQRYDSLSCYGGTTVRTPRLDELAAAGARFEHCYVNGTICTPSRASIMTGKPLPGHGVYKLHDCLPDDQVCFTERLQESGYKTALFGKLHVSGRVAEAAARHPHDGFDVYEWCNDPAGLHFDSALNAYGSWLLERFPEVHAQVAREGKQMRHFAQQAHFTRWAAQRATEFLRDQDGQSPFFCKLSLFDPHDPYWDYPEEMAAGVDLSQWEPRPAPAGEAPLPDAVAQERERLFRPLTDEALRASRLGYDASVAFLDQEIGQVLDTLDTLGLRDNTLVLFVSDHGDMLGDRELMEKGAFLYEACTRVPLLMRWPQRIAPGTVVSALVQPHDLAATALAAAGCAEAQRLAWMPHAADLLPLAAGEQAAARDHAVCLYRNSGYGPGGTYYDPPIHASMYRDPRYKLNVYHHTAASGEPQGELYDMAADPQETVNLWRDPAHEQTRRRLEQRLLDWLVEQDWTYNGSRGGEAIVRQSRG